ncbi:MAG: hypothetical protein ACOYYS_18900 [Chloroflexota bacterium]
MKRQFKLLQAAGVLSLVLALVLTSTAFAITITVDGTREAAWDGGGSATDDGGNEGSIRDGNDIDRVEYTNDGTYYYILIDTFGNVIWNNTFGADPNLYICLNVDNNSSGASGVTQCDNGNMAGVDYILEFLGGTTISFNIYDSSFNSVSDSNRQVQFANDITEIRVTASAIGLSPSNCLSTMPTSIYFDNGVADPEDYTPDSGTVSFGCGSPTALTLTAAKATSTPPLLAGMVAGGGLLGVVGLALLRRRKEDTR